ncbi:hypothetical protein B0H10DRAFT_2206987 [Mycena sp. CBHHK59/15]|nr:hypothetical protein B0H10DRAFT_2206987 [Mycena sp. CBHHK59/15]
MNTLEELRAYIRASGAESPADANANISASASAAAYIETHILSSPAAALFTRHVPPLDIILFAIRSVLAPPHATASHVPDLLDFATTVEFYRACAVKRGREALVFGAYYRGEGEGDDNEGEEGRTNLTRKEEEYLHEHTSEEWDAQLREIYIELVLQYCILDIHTLWTASPPCPAAVAQRLCEYFPRLVPTHASSSPRRNSHTSPRLFHFDLSDAERARVDETGRTSCVFVRDSCAWAEERARKGGPPLHQLLPSPAHAAAFPCAVDARALCATTAFYLACVEDVVRVLEGMFPSRAEGE